MTVTSVVRPLPGPGLVARSGDLMLVCAEGTDATRAEVEQLLALVPEVAATGGDGTVLVRRVAALLAADLDGLFPDCAVCGPIADGRLAVLVYGSATARVVGGDGEVRLSAVDAVASVNRLIPGPITSVRLELPGAGEPSRFARLEGGVVSAAGFLAGEEAPGGAAAAFPVTVPAQPSPDPGPPAPEPAVAEPVAVAPAPIVSEPVVAEPAPVVPEPPVAEPAGAEPVVVAPAPVGSEPAEAVAGFREPPPAPSEPSGWTMPASAPETDAAPAPEPDPAPPSWAGPSVVDASIVPSDIAPLPAPATDSAPLPAPATDSAPPPAPATDSAPPPAPATDSAPPPAPVTDSAPPLPTREPLATEPIGVEARPTVLGLACPLGHLNDPSLTVCVACGSPLSTQPPTLREGPRPPLGMITLDDGSQYILDIGYVLGREPQHDPEVVAGGARPLKIVDVEGVVSRRHLRVALVGWDIQIIDLGSANGTYVQYPDDPQLHKLEPHHAIVVKAGTTVTMGRRSFRIDPVPPEQRG